MGPGNSEDIGPRSIDGQPRDQSQWWDRSLPGWAAADKLAWKQALRPKPCKLAMHGQLRQAVVRKLELNWSPEQIAGWLKRASPETEAWRVSHETIYRSLYVQARGVVLWETAGKRSGRPSSSRSIRLYAVGGFRGRRLADRDHPEGTRCVRRRPHHRRAGRRQIPEPAAFTLRPAAPKSRGHHELV